MVQYGDFQCEHCANAYAVIKQLQRDAILFVFRHFPLKNLHPLAIDAAKAAGARLKL
jgi:protein-disulfide isomerase